MNTEAGGAVQEGQKPKILIITTMLSSYLAADALGQLHIEYPASTFVMRTPDPVVFPQRFYMETLRKGIDGIIIASAGTDCPYEGAYSQLARTIDGVYKEMKEAGMDLRRVRLTAVCSVCTHHLLKEIKGMAAVLDELKAAGKS
jgi:coenzyme F420-reducing hydrogenase delta subunit